MSDERKARPEMGVDGKFPEPMIKVDGRGQVLEMLRAADPEFREVILRGIEKRDARLARELRKAL